MANRIRRLRAMRAHDSVLFRRKKPPPFFIGTGDFEGLAWQCLSLPWGLRNKPHTSKIGDVQSVFLDEFAAGLDDIAHQFDENILDVVAFLRRDTRLREEARAIAQGRMDKENNPLKNAPHTVEDLVGEWNRPYSREAACFPAGAFRVDKYWPPVNRVDNVYGDRNLVCACAPMETYIKAAE